MDINAFMLVLLWIIIGLLIIALLFGAFWWTYHKGQSSTEENINKALVFQVNGRHISRPKKAKLEQSTDKTYQYRYGNNLNDILFVSKKLKTKFYRGASFVFLEAGKIFGVDIDGNDGLEASEKETLLKEFVKANIGSGAVKAIQKSQPLMFNIVLIIIALAVGAGGVLLFQSFKESATRQQTQQTPVQQQIIPAK